MSLVTNGKPVTIHQLRSRWKPHKQRLLAARPDHPLPIRIHRACSWLSVVENMGDKPDYDSALIHQWIAFNALYGQWDDQRREPKPDRECWRRFLDRILSLDTDGHVGEVLTGQRRLVMDLLDDEYLSSFFWQEPSPRRAGQSRKAKYDAQTWYIERNWTMVLDRLLERVYLLRCQLVHGAATHGSKLNRRALHRCSGLLSALLPAVLLVLIDRGPDEDWGTMCYPPIEAQEPGLTRNRPR